MDIYLKKQDTIYLYVKEIAKRYNDEFAFELNLLSDGTLYNLNNMDKGYLSCEDLVNMQVVCKDFNEKLILEYLAQNDYYIKICGDKNKLAKDCKCRIYDAKDNNASKSAVATYASSQELADAIWALTF